MSPFCGGAERMTITIAKLLDRSEYDVRFFVIGRQIGEIKDFIPNGYPLSLIKIRNIIDFTTLRLYRVLRKIYPQYVFCSLHYLNPQVIQAANWIGRCKIIIRFNCAVENVQGILRYVTIKTYSKADVIIAQTEKMRDDIIEVFHLSNNKVLTLHNLIDQETIVKKIRNATSPYENENRKKFVWVGRFDKIKGADIAVEAFTEAYRKDNNICLYMVGKVDDGNEYYQYVKRLVGEREMNGNIYFVGFQNNPYCWMKFANCFILSSRSEGSPNALFESLYLGIPAVATRCTPNIDDIIKEGENGYIVDVGDIQEMSIKMLKALKLEEVKIVYNHSTSNDFKNLFK